MCGITGYVKLKTDAKPHSGFIASSLELMKHRGPDAQKSCLLGSGGEFGHARLSIIDTRSVADQPMESEKSIIVFNGEIYNYQELKLGLGTTPPFSTTSDTEVLQRGLESEGVEFLHKANGMFACAFFNKSNRELFLIRDRFGVKPLYYSICDSVLYFASEIKPLLRLRSHNRFNEAVIKAFLNDTATDFDEHSPYENVFQVKKGHYLTIRNNTPIQVCWYKGADYRFDEKVFRNKKATLDFVEDLLTDAIKARLISDVPVCITLSGGLDSTVIYTLLHERLRARIQPFTFSHPGAESDELESARLLAKEYGEEVIKVVTGDISLKDIESALYYLEFPIWNSSGVAYLAMYKAIASKNFKVVIEGHGSDEQLGGYQHLVLSGFNQLVKTGHLMRAFRLLPMILKLERFPGSLPRFAYHALRQFIRNPERNFQKNLDVAFDYKILPIVLRTFDRLPMACSVESRSPFMDYRLVEVFKKMPMRYKLSPLGSKAILREILKKYNKTGIYQNKTKRGFGAEREYLENWKTESLAITKKLFSIA